MSALALLLSKIKLIHYVLIGAIIFGLSMLTYSKVLSMRLEASEGQFLAFAANVEAEGYKQQAKNWQERQKRDAITRELEIKNVETKNNRDSKYAEYRRLLHSNSRSSSVPALSDQTRESICRQNEETVTRSMERLESGILDILQQGQAGIDAAIVYEDWIDAQTKVLQDIAHQ